MKKYLLTIFLCWTVLVERPKYIVDGDSFDADIPVWMARRGKVMFPERIRLLGVDTPEMKRPTMPEALAAKDFTAKWLAAGPFYIFACDRDAFGRVLGKVFRGEEVLSAELAKAGHIK
jgi:endonuclease YncB( thermonuclease family)